MTAPVSLDKEAILAHFACQNSGNCCKAGGYVYVTLPELLHMAHTLGITAAEFRERYVIQYRGWDMIATPTYRTRCFLDENNRCQIYDARPAACRSYPDWPEIWASEDTLTAECNSCPGLQKAVATARRSQGQNPVVP